ncbi:MAG: LPS assembly protein LptD, partial [Acidobacteriota bacterium]
NVRVKLRNLPSVHFEKRPSMVSFLKPLYFSFQTSGEGVSRREEVDNLALYQQTNGNDPIITATLLQRFDVFPELTLPINTKYFNFTATAGGRLTYYSNSLTAARQVVGRDLLRKYGEFQFDIRPVALAKNYYGKNDAFRFRHVIEPFVTYRFVKGVNDFQKIIRIDELDTIADTNEIEFGLTNRIYTRRYSEAVTDEAQKLLRETDAADKKPLSVQPYEIFNLTVRGKYFFDKTFGGALIPGRRNQLEPITAVSFYTFGGVPRRFSPLNIDATYRPQRTVYVNTRVDLGVHGDGIRAASATIGYETPLLKFFQTLYYTRAVDLIPSLQLYANREGKEPGTLKGAQWGPSVFVGNRNRGPYGGASFFFDFENRRASGLSPLISSLYTAGYAYDCCSLAVQFYTFNVGVRNENRVVFSFRLNGIGSFGTEQFGQGLR